MINRKECKKMWVWDGNRRNAIERIVSEYVPNGGCYTVNIPYEEAFLSGDVYERRYWRHYEEIKEPEWRAFKSNKELLPYLTCWFSEDEFIMFERILRFCPRAVKDVVKLSNENWYDLNSLFVHYQMQVNGVWQPVGRLVHE